MALATISRCRMAMVRIQPLPGPLDEGRGVSEYLAAYLRCERAIARRLALAHVSAVLGIPLWLCLTLSPSRRVVALALTFFTVAIGALAGALVREVMCRRILRERSRSVDVHVLGDREG